MPRGGCLVKAQMPGAVQGEEAAALKDAIDDGRREILVMEHPSRALRDLLVVKITERLRR